MKLNTMIKVKESRKRCVAEKTNWLSPFKYVVAIGKKCTKFAYVIVWSCVQPANADGLTAVYSFAVSCRKCVTSANGNEYTTVRCMEQTPRNGSIKFADERAI